MRAADSGEALNQRKALRGYLFIAGATFLWGASAMLGKAVFTGMLKIGGTVVPRLEALVLAQSRTTISFLLLAPLVLIRSGAAGLRLNARDAWRCILLGVVGLAGSNYFYYYAIDKTSVATAITIQYTAPVWVLLYMVAAGRQRATAARVAAVALAFAGIALVIGVLTLHAHSPFVQVAHVRLNLLGVLASLGAALSFSFYNIYGQGLVQKHERGKVLTYALFGVAVFWMFFDPPWRIIAAHYTREQWLFMLIFSILSMLLPFLLYFSGLRLLDPTSAIVTSCLEPVFAIAFAAAFVHETIGAAQVMGIALVLAATIVVELPGRRHVPAEAAI